MCTHCSRTYFIHHVCMIFMIAADWLLLERNAAHGSNGHERSVCLVPIEQRYDGELLVRNTIQGMNISAITMSSTEHLFLFRPIYYHGFFLLSMWSSRAGKKFLLRMTKLKVQFDRIMIFLQRILRTYRHFGWSSLFLPYNQIPYRLWRTRSSSNTVNFIFIFPKRSRSRWFFRNIVLRRRQCSSSKGNATWVCTRAHRTFALFLGQRQCIRWSVNADLNKCCQCCFIIYD